MTVKVSVATDDEADDVSALAARTFQLACPPGSSPVEIAAFVEAQLSPGRFRDYIADPGRTVLLARAGADVVGYAMLIETSPTDPDVLTALTMSPSLEISKMYVDATRHGAGVAAALMKSAVDHAEANHVPALWLGVNNENARAQKFYAKSGFTVVGEKTFTLGSEIHHDYVMERLTRMRSETTPADAT